MKQSIKIGLFLIFTTLNANLIFAQTADALIITPQGNVNVVSGKVQERGNDLLPKGAIIMWSGDKVPPGWALCDGSLYVKESGKTDYIKIKKEDEGKYTNEPDKIRTPDLVDRFVVGAGGEYPDAKSNRSGGQKFVTLTEDNLPSHSHEIDATTTDDLVDFNKPFIYAGDYSDSGKNKSKSLPVYYNFDASYQEKHLGDVVMGGAHKHNIKGNTKSTGKGQQFDSRPPFYALYYIMKL